MQLELAESARVNAGQVGFHVPHTRCCVLSFLGLWLLLSGSGLVDLLGVLAPAFWGRP